MDYHNKILYIVQGDDSYLYITIIQPDGHIYEMQAGDIIKMTIKQNIDSVDNIVIQSNSNVLTFTKSQTNQIPLGRNIYDVKLILAENDNVFTIIPASTLICQPSVGGA